MPQSDTEPGSRFARTDDRRTGASTASTAVAQPDLAALSRIARDPGRTLERVLRTAREQLGMDIAYVAALRDGVQVYETLDGDASSFGLAPGTTIPAGEGVCRYMVDGKVPEVIPDLAAQPLVAGLEGPKAAGAGSYVGVPLRLSDGRLYGTLCTLSHEPEPTLGDRDARFLHVLAGLVAEQIEREELEAEKSRLEVQTAGVSALLAALAARDDYTGDHSTAVVELAAAVARELGLTAVEIAEVEQVALLHDIGKVGIPDAILRKPGPLTDEEWAVMRTHPEIGARIVAGIDGLAHLAPAIRAEHERWDGGGYPDGLAGEQVPLASRIVLACDAFHAMTSDRPYRRAMPLDRALEQLRAGAGSQFCPTTVPALLAALDRRTAALAA